MTSQLGTSIWPDLGGYCTFVAHEIPRISTLELTKAFDPKVLFLDPILARMEIMGEIVGATEASNRFGQLLDMARSEPVTIEKKGGAVPDALWQRA